MSSSTYSCGGKRRNGQEWSREMNVHKRCARDGLHDSRWIDNPAVNCPSTSSPSPPVFQTHLVAHLDSPRDVWEPSSGNSRHYDRVNCNCVSSVDEAEETKVLPGSGMPARYSRCEHHHREQFEVAETWRASQDHGSNPRSRHRETANRFNLSRYRLSDDELAHTREKGMPSGDHHDDGDDDHVAVKRNALSRGRAAYDADWTSLLSPSGNVVDPRKKLLDFREHVAGHGVIPSTWAGEQRLHEWVGFGNIEDALRPLGLVMARASLVSNSTI